MPSSLLTSAEVTALLSNRPEKTRTWLTEESVPQTIIQASTATMREMTPEEVSALAQYLEEPAENMKGPFFIDLSLICPSCNRKMTFLDFVKTVMGTEHHGKQMIADILAGRNGFWITIAGRTDQRSVNCANCNYLVEYSEHNYAASTYAYA